MGFRVSGPGFIVQSLGFRVEGLVIRVLGLRGSESAFWVKDLRFRV